MEKSTYSYMSYLCYADQRLGFLLPQVFDRKGRGGWGTVYGIPPGSLSTEKTRREISRDDRSIV